MTKPKRRTGYSTGRSYNGYGLSQQPVTPSQNSSMASRPDSRPQSINEPEFRGPDITLDKSTIMKMQMALSKQGYLDNSFSARLDMDTVDALQKFQADKGLESSGIPDMKTLSKLGLSR
jgi:hypothetical protein